MPNHLKLFKNIFFKRPVLCLWQITNRCNFSCKICKFWKEKNPIKEELTTEQFNMVLQNLKTFSPMLITLAGGEPLLRPDLPELVRLTACNNYCSIITNGWHMTRELAKELYKQGMQDAMVSLDYAVPELHDIQRGKKHAFERAVQAIEYLKQARPDLNHKIRILAVLMDDNLDHLEGLLLIAEELSATVTLTLYSDYFGKLPPKKPRPDITGYLLELKKRHKNFNSAIKYLNNFDKALKDGMIACGGGKTFININYKGEVSRCVDRYDQPVGSLLTAPVKELKKKLSLEAAGSPCTECWTSCRGLADIITGIKGIQSYKDFYNSYKKNRNHL